MRVQSTKNGLRCGTLVYVLKNNKRVFQPTGPPAPFENELTVCFAQNAPGTKIYSRGKTSKYLKEIRSVLVRSSAPKKTEERFLTPTALARNPRGRGATPRGRKLFPGGNRHFFLIYSVWALACRSPPAGHCFRCVALPLVACRLLLAQASCGKPRPKTQQATQRGTRQLQPYNKDSRPGRKRPQQFIKNNKRVFHRPGRKAQQAEGRKRPTQIVGSDAAAKDVGSRSQAGCLQRNTAMDDSIGGS